LLLERRAVLGRQNNVLLEVNVAPAIQAWFRTPDWAVLQIEAVLKQISEQWPVDSNARSNVSSLKINGDQPASAVAEEISRVQTSFQLDILA